MKEKVGLVSFQQADGLAVRRWAACCEKSEAWVVSRAFAVQGLVEQESLNLMPQQVMEMAH